MRAIDAEFQARLDGGATGLCRCWRVDRVDGAVFGFTDHDEDLSFEGIIYRASSGLDASALRVATGLSVDNAEVFGALTDAAVTEADIRAGRFDGAEVRQWLVDWRRPDLRVSLFRGSFGEIRRVDGRFEVELRGLAEAFNIPKGRNLLTRCDATLGDARCGFDVERPGFSVVAEAGAGSTGGRLVTAGQADFANGWFAGGRLVWLSGENEGSTGNIKADALGVDGMRLVRLWEDPPSVVAVGDRFRMVAGCDKQPDTCRAKFGNFMNFRGFPHIPGEDWVTAYPKDGDMHDGGSQR